MQSLLFVYLVYPWYIDLVALGFFWLGMTSLVILTVSNSRLWYQRYHPTKIRCTTAKSIFSYSMQNKLQSPVICLNYLTFLGCFRLIMTSLRCLVNSLFELEHHYRVFHLKICVYPSSSLVELMGNFSSYPYISKFK